MSDSALGALSDTQFLLRRAARLLAYDPSSMTRAARDSAKWLALAWGVLIIGGVLVGFGVGQTLHAQFPQLPLGVWFAGLGLATLVGGGVLIGKGRGKLDALQPFQGDTAAAAAEAGQVVVRVDEAIESTKDALRRTADTLHETIASVKQATDLTYQVDQRPWTMVAGAAGVGFVGGTLLNATSARPAESHTPHAGNGSTGNLGGPHAPSHGLFAHLGDALAPHAGLAREIAVGALFGMARDFARKGVSKSFEGPMDDFFNDAAKRYGVRPTPSGASKTAAAPTPPGHVAPARPATE